MKEHKCYVLTTIDESNIDKEISAQVFMTLEAATAAFEELESKLKEESENPGTYFLDESHCGKYIGYVESFRTDNATIILQEASIN